MFIMSLQAVTAALIFLYIGISYYVIFPRTVRGASFLMLSCCLAWWAFCSSFRYGAPDAQTAGFWFLLGGGGFLFFPAFGLRHFAYRSKDSGFVTGPGGYAIFLPPLLLFAWLLRLVPGHIAFVNTPLGWKNVLNGWSVFMSVYTAYYSCYLGGGLILYLNDDALGGGIYGVSRKTKYLLLPLCALLGFSFVLSNFPLRAFRNFPDIFPIFSAACGLLVWIFFLSRNVPVLSSPEVAAEVLENIYDALVAVKEDGRIIYSNEKARLLTGFSGAYLSGLKLPDLFAAPKPDLNFYGRKEGASKTAELRLTLLDRHSGRIPVNLSLSVVTGFSGGVKGGIAIIRDIRAEIEYKTKQDEHRWRLAAALSDLTAQRDLLKKINEEVVERELKMIGIKKEINGMLLAAGESPRYKVRDRLK